MVDSKGIIGMKHLGWSATVAVIFTVFCGGGCGDGDGIAGITGGNGNGAGAGGAGIAGGGSGTAGSDTADSNGGVSSGMDLTEAVYAEDHLVRVEIEIDPEDWDALRSEGRSLLRAMYDRGYAYEYTYFDANVTIDGELYENVGVRKKGFLGSLSMYRPSVKIDLDRNVPDQAHSGVKKLTLNNNQQDQSNARQCMAYRLFSRAGSPASRCNLARVLVNGEDLGTYANVEPVSKAMLARHFEDPDGNLYEGQAADFDRETVDHFEAKTDKQDADRSDLERVVEALERPDDEVVEALGAVVDLDSFRTFWAMEVLVGHWDSYSGNANNFYAYHDPTSDRFHFIPWGTDGAFDGLASFDPERDITVFAVGKIASRLYGLSEERERYRARLTELVDTVWDGAALDAELTQIAELAQDSSQADLNAQRAFIETRVESMRAALAEPASGWTGAGLAPGTGEATACQWMMSDLEVEFNTQWGNLMTDTPAGEFTVEMSLDEQAQQLEWTGMAGLDMFTGTDPVLQMSAALPDQRTLLLSLMLAPNTMKPGVWPFHGMESWGMVSVMSGMEFRMLSYVGDGEITFDEASTEAGAPVVGQISASILQVECLDP